MREILIRRCRERPNRRKELRWVCEYHSQMVRDELNVLSAFLAVAEGRSFTKAAKRLGVSVTL